MPLLITLAIALRVWGYDYTVFAKPIFILTWRITGVEYSESQEIVNKWGAGRHPVGRAKGRITPSCKLILYQEEVQALSAQSPTGRLQDLPPVDIIVQYIPDSGQLVTDKIRNINFSENARKWKEGDTGQEVELPGVPSHIEWGKAA